jgi:thioredoxin reductase (NADPH)
LTEILILGSGPAGYTAAIYSARAGRRTKLISGPNPGGQLMITSLVENYPGFAEPIAGPELMQQMLLQTERAGVEICSDVIATVDLSVRPFVCVGESGERYKTKALIIATGARARWLGIPGEEKYRGAGVSSCATCDGFFFRNKHVVVVGGGNSAVEEATYLSKMVRQVTLIHRRDALRADKIMVERLLANPKIQVVWDTEVTEIVGDENRVTTLLLANVKTGEATEMAVDGVFIAIGHDPMTEIFKSQLDLAFNGHISVCGRGTQTSVTGVFAAGDVCDPFYRQAVTSAAHGCMAAIDADNFLSVLGQ